MADATIGIKITGDASGLEASLGGAARTVEQFGGKVKDATESIGISAKQTAAALRGVPAQFTDIITSIQGGQAPLTVFLQQGGQLKDMFGGAGAAAKALGGYVLGLINPFTVAAGSAAALAYAYSEGARESEGYNKALILTGNAAGTTSLQMQRMASSVSAATGITKGAAAEALTAFASNGTIAAASLEKFTGVAVKFQREAGVAVSDTVKQFAELGKEPLAASLKLNESTHYLTLSVYEQIKALEEQGRSSEAAAVAQNAYADAISQRIPELEQNLGTLERAGRTVAATFKGMWDSVLNVGRPQDPAAEIAAAIAASQNRIASLQKLGPGTDTARSIAAEERRLAISLKVQDQLLHEQRTREVLAETVGEQNKLLQQKSDWDKKGLEYLTKQEKMLREIAKATNEAKPLLDAGVIDKAAFDTRISNIREKFTEKDDSLREYNDLIAKSAGLNADFAEKWDKLSAAYRGGKISVEELTIAQRELLKEQTFAKNIAKELEEIESQRNKEMAENYAENAKAVEAAQKYAESLDKQVIAEKMHVAQIGLSKVAIAELEAAKLSELVTSKERLATIADEVDASHLLGDAYRQQAKDLRELAKLKTEGAEKEAAVEAAKKAAEEWKRAADKIENSITDALMRGFENGKGFAENLRDTVVNMFKTMVLRPVVSAIVSPVAAVLAGGAPGSAMAGQGGGVGGSINSLSSFGNLLSGGSNGAGMLSTIGGWFSDFGGSLNNSLYELGGSLTNAGFESAGSWVTEATGTLNGSIAELTNGTMNLSSAANALGDGLGYLAAATAASEGQWGRAIGTAAGTYFGGPIGAAIGGEIGGWLDNAFSGGREYNVDSGISGTFGREGFAGQSFTDWRNDGSSGIFGIGGSSASSGTRYSALDTATKKGLSRAFFSVQMQTAGFAQALGLSAEQILNFTKDVRVSLTADAEQNKKAIQDLLVGISNDLANTVLDSQYIREGETASGTLARLATNLGVVNNAFETLGKTALTIGQAGGDSASRLIDLLGGLEKFTTSTLSYYQTFYTEAERNAKTSEQLAQSFADLGIEVPDSLRSYRDLVNAQDINTDAGRKMYAALIGLSGAFASVTQSAAEAAKALIKTFRYSTYADYAAAMASAGGVPVPRFAGGGLHGGGLRIVGENGPELEATGPSRIWNAMQLNAAVSGGGDEIAALREENRAQGRTLAALLSRMVKLQETWDANGMPEVRAV